MASFNMDSSFSEETIENWHSTRLEDTELLENILSRKDDVLSFLARDTTSIRSMHLLVHVLGRAVGCKLRRDRPKVYDLLNLIIDSPLLNLKGIQLLTESASMGSHALNSILNDYIVLLQCLYSYMPSSLGTPQIIGFVDLLKDKIDQANDIENHFVFKNRVFELQNSILSNIAEGAKTKKVHGNNDFEDSIKPPQSFRDISVMPEEHDLFYETTFLRRNKKYGKYNDLEHYLDVQFRLYREDCIIPLREVFQDFLLKNTNKQNRYFRLNNGRIYRDVQILKGTSTSLEHGEVFTVHLDHSHCRRINWNNSKRLNFGSLLLLSFNDFKTSFFAVVSEVDHEVLKQVGHFKVQIFKTRPNQIVPRKTKGIILEATSAYFEAYHHVLNAIQAIQDSLPFQKYIVDCVTEIDMPKFLSKNLYCKFDFQPILENIQIQLSKDAEFSRPGLGSLSMHGFGTGGYQVQLLNIDDWPAKELLHLDESQRQAFITALTKEFVIIQGPPGTGKTFLGLQIAKVLLHNKDKWKNISSSKYRSISRKTTLNPCLLVVCYTNHALDQFIEGIINFLPTHSSSEIVRIGSQSKYSNLEQYSIKAHRKSSGKKCKPFEVTEKANKCKQIVLTLRKLLKTLKANNIVLDFQQIQGFMQERHRQHFDNFPVEAWLDRLHVSPKSWFTEVEKRCHNERSKTCTDNRGKKVNDEYLINVVEEADHTYIERSLDDDVDFSLDISLYGVDVQKQLMNILQPPFDEKCKVILQEEVNNILAELKSDVMASKLLMNNSGNIWELHLSDRWKMYRFWLKCYLERTQNKLETAEKEFNSIFKDYKQARVEIDEDIMRKASVIAMTTTGAAKYHKSLQKVCPQITIIEEAAEVPEAHIVTAINPRCEHVILIGDHKQLEPKPAVMKLAVKYNLSISLFERMLNNGLHYHCLEQQHRMRPEISNLVRHMYPVLEDNENVHQYEDIRGIRQNLFFIDHDQFEQFNEEGKSYSNEFEAIFVVRLCDYLLKQGYQGTEITIIAAYMGQMFCIREKMPRSRFEGVNICVLDNYQGEENEIILLSLTRSNENGDIGFLSRENRICVALSRAKKGLYIIGNSSTLTKRSQQWQFVMNKIKEKRKQTQDFKKQLVFFGNALPLYCQNHPKEAGIFASKPEDFSRSPDGGCSKPCQARLDCGHACRYRCHPLDRDHVAYRCIKLCRKHCKDGHVCEKQCHYPRHCKCTVLMKRLLKCNHIAHLECYINLNTYLCKKNVVRTLNCGHCVVVPCHAKLDTVLCKEKVAGRRGDCDHEYVRECHDQDFEKSKCLVKVEKTFSWCGHTKIVRCFMTVETFRCEETVKKVLECSHVLTVLCYKYKAGDFKCKEKCKKICEIDHICDKVCHFPLICCCETLVPKILPKCGHTTLVHCAQNVDTFNGCNIPVEMIRHLCGHHVTVECSLKAKIENAILTSRDIYEKDVKCDHLIEYEIPACKHITKLPCWIKTGSRNLIKTLIKTLSNTSYDTLSGTFFTKCEFEVSIKLGCGHNTNIECWKLPLDFQKLNRLYYPLTYQDQSSAIKCSTVVTAELECGHDTQIECWQEKNQSYLYLQCKTKVDIRLIPCGHSFTTECCNKISGRIALCEKEITYRYPECHHDTVIKCYQNPNLMRQKSLKRFQTPSKEQERIPPCSTFIKRKLECGHTLNTLCHVVEHSILCKEKCNNLLFCGHRCSDLCDNCKTRGTHKKCECICNNELVCGHNCEDSRCLTCTVCRKQCEFVCEHSTCTLLCNEICKPCEESCSWICPHFECTKSCAEECDRPLCSEDCKLTLSCGHACPGYCGEPCPVACKSCDAERYTEKLETMSNGKYVTLRKCFHSFDSDFLDDFISKSVELVVKCPVCQTIVHKHPRYGSILKRNKRYLEQMKNQLKAIRVHPLNFPVMDQRITEQFVQYIGKFFTYLQIVGFIERDEKSQTEIGRLEEKGEHLIECMKNITGYNFQNWLDVSDAIFLLHIDWMLRLCSTNKKLMEQEFKIKTNDLIETQRESKGRQGADSYSKADDSNSNMEATSTSVNAQHSQQNEEKNHSLLREAKGAADVYETMMTGQQIIQMVREGIKDGNSKKVKSLIELMTKDIKDEPHVTDAMEYPKLTIAMGVHSEDWALCKAGHVTLAVVSDTCLTCSGECEIRWVTRNEECSLNIQSIGRTTKRGRGRGKRGVHVSSIQDKTQKQMDTQRSFATPWTHLPTDKISDDRRGFMNNRGKEKQQRIFLPTQNRREVTHAYQRRPRGHIYPAGMVQPQGQYLNLPDRDMDENRYRGRGNRRQRQRGGRQGAGNTRSVLADSNTDSMFQFRTESGSDRNNSRGGNYRSTNRGRRGRRGGRNK